MKLFLRFIHLIVVVYLFAGIFYIYYAAVYRVIDLVLIIFVLSLIFEGVIIYLNHGNCPFGYFQKIFGDNTPFFELILPKKYAKRAVRFCAYITLFGMLLLTLRLLFTS